MASQAFVAAAAVLAFMLAVMGSAWAYQRAKRNGGWTDVFWTFGTGASGVAVALWPDAEAYHLRQILVAALVAIWSLRLGGYMAMRVAGGPEDVRYQDLRGEWGQTFDRRMARFLLIQAPVTAALTISIYLAAHRPQDVLDLQDAAGLAILASAIFGESVADAQMKRFKAQKRPGGAVCDEGLWAWSRHPNYFFEWFGWLAYPVIAIRADDLGSLLSLIAPALMLLILTRLTGVVLLEAAMIRTKGDAYRDYQRRVPSAFFPFPPWAARSTA